MPLLPNFFFIFFFILKLFTFFLFFVNCGFSCTKILCYFGKGVTSRKIAEIDQNIRQKSRNLKIESKIEILVKNQNFGQKSKFRSKIKILVKNQNFGQKSKFSPKKRIISKMIIKN